MDLDHYSRKLAAILFTDMVGYTAVMQKDELKAIKMQKKHQHTVEQCVSRFGGEVKNDMGDGSMSILPSAYEVIQCAMAIQKELQREPDKVNIRVGIHIADILIEDSGKVHGDGINIASRIETLGVAGAILFSKEVHNKIKNHPEFKTALVGLFPFKNVEEPMEIYAIANEGYSVPSETEALANGKLKKTGTAPPGPSNSKSGLSYWLYLLIIPIAFIGYYIFSQKNVSLSSSNKTELILDSTQIWKGQIVHFDSRPASGVIIDVNGGVAKDTSDPTGNFELILPKSYINQRVNISLYYQGKLNLSHQIRLSSPEVLSTLKLDPK
ncbi:MAG: adenylate/guanylate cyclase domain-containing protein [Saprospiraceae bacterium]